MERPTPLTSWVNPFPSRFINRAIFFRSAPESFECASCLLSFLYFHCLSSIYLRAKPSQGAVLFISLLGKGLTPRACMVGGGSIWWTSAVFYWFLSILEGETCFSWRNFVVSVSPLLTIYFLLLVTHLQHIDCLHANLWDQSAVRQRLHGQNRDKILTVISLSRHD